MRKTNKGCYVTDDSHKLHCMLGLTGWIVSGSDSMSRFQLSLCIHRVTSMHAACLEHKFSDKEEDLMVFCIICDHATFRFRSDNHFVWHTWTAAASWAALLDASSYRLRLGSLLLNKSFTCPGWVAVEWTSVAYTRPVQGFLSYRGLKSVSW